MKCVSPIKNWYKDERGNRHPINYQCGQCMPCRIQRRQQIVLRILLEAKVTPFKYFVTLTYNDEHLPRDGVSKEAITRFVRKFRREAPIRFFGCGEYGERTLRAHYHLILFSDQEIPIVQKVLPTTGRLVDQSDQVSKAWTTSQGDSLGISSISNTVGHSDITAVARYTAGYVTKKLTSVDSVRKRVEAGLAPRSLLNWNPEFSHSSRRPGIGLRKECIELVARGIELKDYKPKKAAQWGDSDPTVNPQMLRFGGKLYPMDRVLKSKIDNYFGGDRRSSFIKGYESSLSADKYFVMEAEKSVEEIEKERVSTASRAAEFSQKHGRGL